MPLCKLQIGHGPRIAKQTRCLHRNAFDGEEIHGETAPCFAGATSQNKQILLKKAAKIVRQNSQNAMQGQKSNCGWTPYQDHHSAEFKINLRIFLSPLKLAALKRTCSLLFLDYLTMWAWKLAINCPQLFTMECALRMQHSIITYRVAAQEYLYIYML